MKKEKITPEQKLLSSLFGVDENKIKTTISKDEIINNLREENKQLKTTINELKSKYNKTKKEIKEELKNDKKFLKKEKNKIEERIIVYKNTIRFKGNEIAGLKNIINQQDDKINKWKAMYTSKCEIIDRLEKERLGI